MREKRFFYLFFGIWEIIRLIILVYSLALDLIGKSVPSTEKLMIFFLLGSGALILPAAAFYIFFIKKSFPQLVVLFIVGKIIELFPCLLSLFFSVAQFINLLDKGVFREQLLLTFFSLFIIFCFDLIFLISLLSLKEGKLKNYEIDTRQIPQSEVKPQKIDL